MMNQAKDNQINLDDIEVPERIPTKFISNRVIVFNPLYASYLYVKKGFFGSPLGINKPRLEYFSKPSELSLIEAFYLLEKNEITIFDVKENKDLREKGYIPRPGLKFGADFVVYKKGPGLEHSLFMVHVLPHDSEITAIDMVRAGRLATSVRKKFVIANPLTKSYYFFEWFKP